MAKLIMNPSSGARKEIPVVGRVLSIGRDPSNDLVLSDSMVSRRHAILETRGDSYVLRDNNSSNGTLVNGDRVANEQPVRDGDLIAIGSCRLLFQTDSSLSPSPPPTELPAASRGAATCPQCGAPSETADRFCRQCGKVLSAPARHVICPNCGSSVVLPSNFCAACGKVLMKEEQRRVPTQPLERHQAGTEGLVLPVPLPAPPPAHVEHVAPRASEPPPHAAAAAPVEPPKPPPVPSVRESSLRAPVRPAARSVPAQVAKSTSGDQPGGFWIRLLAYLIDGIIIGLPSSFVYVILLFFLIPTLGSESADPTTVPGIWVTAMVVPLLLSAGYFVYFWALHGWTLGKKIVDLTIVTVEGDTPIGFGRAFLRLLGYFLNLFTLGIGFLLIAFSAEKRGLHDLIAGTKVVVRRR